MEKFNFKTIDIYNLKINMKWNGKKHICSIKEKYQNI